jgi:transposase InsO family protein
LWTSLVVSFSSYKYYLVVLDDFSHYSWTFPLRNKSDTCTIIQNFVEFVRTQFHVTIQSMQCDNGGKFLTNTLRTFFAHHGIAFRLSFPHTSPQNGKAKRLIRTTNDIIRALLLQAKLPPPFWVEALHTATHLLNISPSRAISFHTPHFCLYGQHPTYDHLRVFGCLCYPNLYATTD